MAKNTIQTDKKVNLASKKKAFENPPPSLSKGLNVLPAFEKEEELCQNISKNLFQLEKDMIYFYFAIKEVKDITKLSEN